MTWTKRTTPRPPTRPRPIKDRCSASRGCPPPGDQPWLWRITTTWLFTAWLVVWMVTLAGAQPVDHPDHDAVLAPKRWRELSRGLSLRPPRAARLIELTPDDAIVRFLGQGGYTLDVYLKSLSAPLGVDQLLERAAAQLATAHPSAAILDQRQLELAQRPAAVIYFAIPDPSHGPWVKAQAFLYADADTLVMLQLEVDQHAYAATRPVFEAVLSSLMVQDQEQLQLQRQEWIQRGIAWLESIPPAQWRDALREERWLRIIENRTDVGYIRIRQRLDTQMDYPGLRMDLQARVLVGDKAYDLISHCFASDDGDYEEWSTRCTLRPASADRGRPSPRQDDATQHASPVHRDTFSWAETGMRSQSQITVSRETLSGIHPATWQRPPKGYLSQIQVQLLERLLPKHEPGEYGFYAYHPDTQKITFHTERVVPSPDGSCVIYSRPSLSHAEQASHYDASGQLIKRLMPGGQALVPTTKRELALRWKIK